MAILYNKPTMTVTCDGCLDAVDFKAKTWQNGIDAMKAAGWKLRPIDGVWKHGCPTCNGRQTVSKGAQLEERIKMVTGGMGRLILPNWEQFLYWSRKRDE